MQGFPDNYEFYTVEFDGIEGYTVWPDYVVNPDAKGTEPDSWHEMLEDIKAGLRELGGGHADIYDENDTFIQDVEV